MNLIKKVFIDAYNTYIYYFFRLFFHYFFFTTTYFFIILFYIISTEERLSIELFIYFYLFFIGIFFFYNLVLKSCKDDTKYFNIFKQYNLNNIKIICTFVSFILLFLLSIKLSIIYFGEYNIFYLIKTIFLPIMISSFAYLSFAIIDLKPKKFRFAIKQVFNLISSNIWTYIFLEILFIFFKFLSMYCLSFSSILVEPIISVARCQYYLYYTNSNTVNNDNLSDNINDF